MANSADGSIRIDTELDNSGFDKGSDKLLSALKDLQQSVDAIGDTLGNGLDSVIKSLQALSSQATTTNQQVTQSAQQATAANQETAQSAQQAAQATAQAGQAATQAGQQVTQSAQAAASATQAMANAPKNVTTEYNSIGRAATSLHDQITRLATAAEIGFKSDGQILRFRDNVEIVTRKVQELRTRLNTLANTRIPTEDYAFLQSEVDKTDKALQRLLDRQQRMDDTGAKQNSATYKRLQYDIDNARQALAAMKAEMSDMEANGEAFTMGSDTAEYQNISGVLSQLETELSGVQEDSSAAQLALSSLGEAHPILATLAVAAQKAGSALLTMGKAIAKTAVHAFSSAIKTLGNGLKAVASKAKQAVSGLLHFNQTAKAGINPVNGLIRGLTSFKTMLLSRLKRSIISDIYENIQTGIQQFALYSSEFNKAMSNIKNASSQVGFQIASLFANIITVVEPVLTRILSLVNSVITAVSALFAKLTGKSTVAVASKGTADYASSLDSAAGSASNAAKEQKKFNAELYGWDELTRQSKQDDSDTSGGGGASTNPTWTEVPVDDILGEWEDIDWFQLGYDWAEKLADALDKIPWDKIQAAAYKLGQHFAELLNGVFANLHLADSLGKTIAEALNTGLSFALGFLETFDFAQFGKWAGTLWNAFVNAFDFDKLARVIELGGNGIITALTTFFQTIASTCETLGSGIAKIFNAIFVGIDFSAAANAILLGINDINLALKGFNDSIDWQGAANNILNGANTLIGGMVLDENGKLTNVWGENGTEVGRLIGGFVDGVHTSVSGLDYQALGENIGLWLTNAFNEINFDNLLDIIVQGFNGIVKSLGSLLGSIDWYSVGKTIATSLLNAVKNIDWANLGTTISNLFIGALDLLNGFIEEMDWAELGKSLLQGLINMLSSIDWVSLIGKLFELLCNVISGAVELLLGALSGLFAGLADAWKGIGNDSVSGFFQGISDTLSNVAAWLKEHIFDPIVNGVKSLFGIASPSTVFAEIGDYLIQGLLQGLSNAWHTITEWFSGVLGGIKETISGAWDTIKTNTSEAWGNIKQGISEKWDNIKTTAQTSADTVKTSVSTAWNTLKTNTSTAYGSIESTVKSKFESAKTSVSTAVETMKSNAVSGWQNMVTNASSKFQSIYTTVQSKMSSVTSHLKSIQWGSIGSNLVNGLLSGLKSAWSSVTSWVSSAASSLTSKLKSAFSIHSPSRIWAEIGALLDAGLVQGLNEGKNAMLSSASNLAESLTDRMTSMDADVQFTDDVDIARLDTITDKLSGIAAIIDHISQALVSMGGLKIPQIAAGTVAPYRTRVAATAGDGYDADGQYGYTSEAVQLLRNIRDYLAANGSSQNSGDIKVIIDGHEIFTVVVDENERAIQRTGSSPIRV